MFDYVFQALKEHALPCCPFCQSKYEGEEQSLNGPVLKWECGTVATHKENKWYRSTDCRDQQVRLLVNDNNALRAEVERLKNAVKAWLRGESIDKEDGWIPLL